MLVLNDPFLLGSESQVRKGAGRPLSLGLHIFLIRTTISSSPLSPKHVYCSERLRKVGLEALPPDDNSTHVGIVTTIAPARSLPYLLRFQAALARLLTPMASSFIAT